MGPSDAPDNIYRLIKKILIYIHINMNINFAFQNI